MFTRLKIIHIYIVPKTFFHIRYEISKAYLIQTQRPHCVPQGHEVK